MMFKELRYRVAVLAFVRIATCLCAVIQMRIPCE